MVLYKEKGSLEKLQALGLNDRQINAVSHTILNSKITNKIYREINNVSHDTSSNELKFLVSLNIFVTEGKERSLSYSINNNI